MARNQFGCIIASQKVLDDLQYCIEQERPDYFKDGEDRSVKTRKFLEDKFSGPSAGLNLEKIEGIVLSGRITGSARCFVVFVKDGDQQIPYVFAFGSNHDGAYDDIYQNPILKSQTAPSIDDLKQEARIDLSNQKIVIVESEKPEGETAFRPQIVFLDDDQAKNLKFLFDSYISDQQVLLNAVAGAGKTMLALDHLAQLVKDFNDNNPEQQEQKKFVYITKSKDLAKKQEEKFINQYGADLAKQVLFISHSDFLRQEGAQVALKDQNQSIAEYKDFLEWYQQAAGPNGDRKFNGKAYPKDQNLYHEFRHLAGNYENHEAYKNAQVGANRFPQKPEVETDKSKKEINRDDLVVMYGEYKKYLSTKGLDDSNNFKLPEQTKNKYVLLLVDEAQQFTRKEMQEIQESSEKPMQSFFDSNQAPVTFRTEHLAVKKAAGFQPAQLKLAQLKVSYRPSRSVAKLAELVLDEINKIGNYGDAGYEFQEDPSREKGRVNWDLKSTDQGLLESAALENAAKNPDKYVIIVPNQKVWQEVKNKYPDAFVTLLRDSNGLEWENVLLYRCIPDGKLSTDDNAVSLGSGPKNKSNLQNLAELDFLRAIFTATTRAKEVLEIVNKDVPIAAKFQKDLREKLAEKPSVAKSSQDLAPKPSQDFAPKPLTAMQLKTEKTTKIEEDLDIASKALVAAANLNDQNQSLVGGQIDIVVRLVGSAGSAVPDQEDLKLELKEQLEGLIKNAGKLLQNNRSLCQKILSGSDVKEIIANIRSYAEFFQTSEGKFNWQKMPKNLDPNLKIGDYTVLNLLIRQSPESLSIFFGKYKFSDLNDDNKKRLQQILYNEISVKIFEEIFLFIGPSKKNSKELLAHLSTIIQKPSSRNAKMNAEDKCYIILDFWNKNDEFIPIVDEISEDKKLPIIKFIGLSRLERIFKLETLLKHSNLLKFITKHHQELKLNLKLIGEVRLEKKSDLPKEPASQRKSKSKKLTKSIDDKFDDFLLTLVRQGIDLSYYYEGHQPTILLSMLSNLEPEDRNRTLLRVVGNFLGSSKNHEKLIQLFDGKHTDSPIKLISDFIEESKGLVTKDQFAKIWPLIAEIANNLLAKEGKLFEYLRGQVWAKINQVGEKSFNIPKECLEIIGSPHLLEIRAVKPDFIKILKTGFLYLFAEKHKEGFLRFISLKFEGELMEIEDEKVDPSARITSSDTDDNIKKIIIAILKKLKSDPRSKTIIFGDNVGNYNKLSPLGIFIGNDIDNYLKLLNAEFADPDIKRAIIEWIKREIKNNPENLENPTMHYLLSAQSNPEKVPGFFASEFKNPDLKNAMLETLTQLDQDGLNPLYVYAGCSEEKKENQEEREYLARLLQANITDQDVVKKIIEALFQELKGKTSPLHNFAETTQSVTRIFTKKFENQDLKKACLRGLQLENDEGKTPLDILMDRGFLTAEMLSTISDPEFKDLVEVKIASSLNQDIVDREEQSPDTVIQKRSGQQNPSQLIGPTSSKNFRT